MALHIFFQTSNDSHVYECLSSSPECDSNLELRHGGGSHLTCKRKSDSNAMEHGAEFKFHHQTFVRSTSLPYCGSETESELYAPYGFYTGDEVRSLGISRTGRGRSREISTCSETSILVSKLLPVSKIFAAATAIRLQNFRLKITAILLLELQNDKSLFRYKFLFFFFFLKNRHKRSVPSIRAEYYRTTPTAVDAVTSIAEQCRLEPTIRAEHCRSVPIEVE